VRDTAVDTVVVNARLRNWVFVKVTTDEPGLHGWGEASLEWKTRAVVGAVEDLADIVIGEDPMRVEHLWQAMFRQQFFKGGIVTTSAISGIEQALHDVKAREALECRCTNCSAGGSATACVYDHLGGGESTAVYDEGVPAAFAERARASVADGFTAPKSSRCRRSRPLEGAESLRRAEALMGAG
jgi:galactonate dehydratase